MAESPDRDENFERDLQEMLDDGPSLNEIGSTVTGGTPSSMSTSYSTSFATSQQASGDSNGPVNTGRIPRSHSVPPGVFAY
jgi:hypothetical protein